MMKNILFPLTLIIVVILGGVSADFLRNRQMETATNPDTHTPKDKPDSHGDKNASAHKKKDKNHKKSKKKSKDSHGSAKNDNGSNAPTYIKFKRQFVVPVMEDGNINSLVLLNLNLELGPDAPANTYTLEPKLRDSIMRELLALSHSGVFSHDLTSADTYEKLQAALLLASQSIITDGVENVLILDLARQDQ